MHLVWGPLGPEPLRAFVEAYRAHPAGAPHELVILFNGVSIGADRAALDAELDGLEHRVVTIDRPLLDLAAYTAVAAQLRHRRLLFVNSYSRPLAEGWLAHMDAAAHEPGVGVVGASGSWGSMASHTRLNLGLGGPYSRVFADPQEVTRVFVALTDGREDIGPPATGGRVARARGRGLTIARHLTRFPSFPAPHVRTNAFIIPRDVLLSLDGLSPADKFAAYELESGRHSITRQLQVRGLRALVVDRGGETYSPEQWPASHTFWQGEQRGLLIADNQTEVYERGSIEVRRILAGYAWGRDAVASEPARHPWSPGRR